MILKKKAVEPYAKEGFVSLNVTIASRQLIRELSATTGYPMWEMIELAIRDFKANLKIEK